MLQRGLLRDVMMEAGVVSSKLNLYAAHLIYNSVKTKLNKGRRLTDLRS